MVFFLLGRMKSDLRSERVGTHVEAQSERVPRAVDIVEVVRVVGYECEQPRGSKRAEVTRKHGNIHSGASVHGLPVLLQALVRVRVSARVRVRVRVRIRARVGARVMARVRARVSLLDGEDERGAGRRGVATQAVGGAYGDAVRYRGGPGVR